MKIAIGKDQNIVDALDIGYDAKGNRRRVLHWLPIYNEIASRTAMSHDALSPMPYIIALDAMKRVGGKKYHNKQYGGGVVFTLDSSELASAVNESIDVYSRWFNANHVNDSIVKQIADRVKCRLAVVVKSTDSGYIASGEYSLNQTLKIKVEYDNNMGLTENPLRAALLWAAKAEFKRWQLNGQESHIKVLSEYTALDANTRVYMYSIEGF